ncbi:MAG: phosphocholine cytidylyltransferase family protein, partial [Dehalococcoidia bacterium]
ILERALGALRENGVEDIVVVRGYKSHLINYPDVTYCHNPEFRKNNILRSLFYAEDEMNVDFIFSYSDIVYSREIVARLIGSEADVALIVDVNWIQTYEGRDQHPISEAELVKVENGKVVKIGKEVVKPEEAHGEFIGLAKFTKSGAETMKAAYRRVSEDHCASPFQNAASLDKAYMTDMLQELVDDGLLVQSVDIEGGWVEIDTPQDLERARGMFGT